MKDKVPPLDVCHLLSKAVAELAEKYELDLIAIDARNASASLERQVANLKGALLAYKGEQVRQREECFEEQLKMKDEKELKSLKVDIHDLSDSIKDIQDDLQRLDIFATGTPSGSWLDNGKYILLIIPAVLLAIICHRYFRNSLDTDTYQHPFIGSVQTPINAMALYNEGMWELFSQYGSQDRNSWLVLRTAGKRVFNASLVKEPAVILLAGDSLTATCFAKELAEVALTALKGNPMAVDSTIIDGTSLRDSDVASVKKALLQQLKSSLSQQSVFTLLALDSLAGDSPLILHSYCDHENAPFKKAFIILTVDVDASGTVGSRECNAAVYRTLADRWKTQLGFNKDKIDPFWARIGKFVICLRSQPNIEC